MNAKTQSLLSKLTPAWTWFVVCSPVLKPLLELLYNQSELVSCFWIFVVSRHYSLRIQFWFFFCVFTSFLLILVHFNAILNIYNYICAFYCNIELLYLCILRYVVVIWFFFNILPNRRYLFIILLKFSTYKRTKYLCCKNRIMNIKYSVIIFTENNFEYFEYFSNHSLKTY